ncbi:MAG TPA: Gfo/Idh/MocA family oxidoreductase [Planctomycetaceae bacterium]|nr:Gfo/Idh/MocA family oxidoreductase [Planctomycetaceae bacterium]
MQGLRLTRRRLLTAGAGLLAVGAVGGVHLYRREPIRIGVIGVGRRGRSLVRMIWKAGLYYPLYGNVVAVCDVHRTHAEGARDSFPFVDIYDDYRKVLERDDIQGVFIATPDHWHVPISLAAIEAGKAVYCEKPLTLTIEEGQALVAAVRRKNAVFQVGTQQRNCPLFQSACELVRNGRLGKLQRITVELPVYPKGGPFPAEPVPPELNWDLWLGQAPAADYSFERFDKYRAFYEYAGGSMTDWGAHHIDIAQWAMGDQDVAPLSVTPHAEMPHIENGYSVPSEFKVDFVYPNGVQMHVHTDRHACGILFEGDQGRIYVNRRRLTGKPVEDLEKNPLPPDAIRLRNPIAYWGRYGEIHIRDFLNCIKTGAQPMSDVASQHRSMTACHLGNIAMRLGRTVHWDGQRERFVDDDEANAMLSRPQRSQYAWKSERKHV